MKVLLTATLLASALQAFAISPATYSATWSGAQNIPDNNASGIAFPFNISAPGPSYITGVTVNLSLTGGWNGDLYAYLSHGAGFSVLLNRVGRTALDPDGFGASGFNISLADANVTDIHNFSGSPVNGGFAPDGRDINPFNALDTSPRNAMLGNFIDHDPDGAWTLFLADVAPAAFSTIQNWTVSIEAVPEPSVIWLTSIGVMALVMRSVCGHRTRS
jgi:subtilisin-like proprotein convertase family protein